MTDDKFVLRLALVLHIKEGDLDEVVTTARALADIRIGETISPRIERDKWAICEIITACEILTRG